MKNTLKLVIISMCVLCGFVIAQSKQLYIKTQQFKVFEQQVSVRVDGEKYATAAMTYDQMMQDALKKGNLERSSCSQRMAGALKWISESDNEVVLDVVFEKVFFLDGEEKEPYVAHVVIDRSKSSVTVTIQEDMPEKKYMTAYSRVTRILNDLLLLHQEDGFKLEEKDSYTPLENSDEREESFKYHRDLNFHCKLMKTAIFEERPRELFRMVSPNPGNMKAFLMPREDGETIALIHDFDCDRSNLYSKQYEYDLKNRIATSATIVRVQSPMLKNETDINEITKKYLGDSNFEDYDVLGSRIVRRVELW